MWFDTFLVLSKVVHGLMAEWKILQVILKHDGRCRGAANGTWVLVVGTEINCTYFFCTGLRFTKVTYEKKLNTVKKI